MEGVELRRSEADTVDLLNQFERILESDPQIDEVGFLHPSQFSKLNKEAGHSSPSYDDSTVLRSADGNSVFWNRDHKLGISTQVLFPLYEAAKHAFMAGSRQYKALNSKSDVSGDEKPLFVSLSLDNSFESDVMKHSRALLLLSSDFGTAWHSSRGDCWILLLIGSMEAIAIDWWYLLAGLQGLCCGWDLNKTFQLD